MSTVYTVLDSRDKNELNMNLQNAKAELQGNIDSLTSKHDEDKNELQQQINTLVSEKATKAELSAHNTSNSAHNDIRFLIQGLTDRLNTLADSDDETLDQMSEIVAYIEDNRDLIESITTSKVNVSDIINNLTTNVANKPLSASMGVELKRLIDAIPDNTETIVNEKILAHNIAGNAHEDIRSDVLDAQSDASGAQATADAAQAAAAAAQADVDDALSRLNSLEVGSGKLDREVSTTDGIVTCRDALVDSGLIETKFYGNTVQNLWVNPSGTHGGITVTSNADGSVTVSGTTVYPNIEVSSDSFILVPGKQYTLSINKNVEQTLSGANFLITFIDSSGSQISFEAARISGTTFTVPENTVKSKFKFYAGQTVSSDNTQTVSGTYRIMLNEGSTAEPWCPPGLNSVGDDGSVNVVTAGKNLAGGVQDRAGNNGCNWEVLENGLVHVSGTPTAANVNTIIDPNASATMDASMFIGRAMTVKSGLVSGSIPSGARYQFTVRSFDASGIEISNCVSTNGSAGFFEVSSNTKTLGWFFVVSGLTIGAPFDAILTGQLELGSTATDYEPPAVTTTPIDLQGHTLNALPDGTRDELHIDGGGNVVLEKRTSVRIADTAGVDGSLAWQTDYTCTNEGASLAGVANDSETYLCDKFPQSGGYPYVSVSATSGLVSLWNGNGSTSPKSIGDSQLPFKTIYKLAEPQTIDLGTIDLPRLPFSTSHVWINGTTVTTNFSLPVNDLSVRYWLPNGELVADIYENGATDEMSDNEIIAIWDGATGDIVEATNADIEAIFYKE